MENEFRQFQAFEDEAEANALKTELEKAGIPVEMKKVNNYLDSVIVGNINSKQQFILNLQKSDFQKAEGLFEQKAVADAELISKDYHLYEFEDTELMEIVDAPDEWSKLDYYLAVKILKERGKEISQSYIQGKKAERLNAKRKPNRISQSALLVAYIIIPIAIILPYFAALLSYFILCYPVILGIYLWTTKKTLSDGTRYHYYDPYSRKHGKWLFILGSLVLVSHDLLFTYFLL